jgi:F-type H+-transporting ATPase subunit gamma
MARVREIKRRIRSVKNIAQVTRAMQMVATSKMRRAQEQALATRAYAAKSWQILTHLASQSINVELLHPLLARRTPVRHTGILLITSDKGLCGAYNTNILRTAVHFIAGLGHPVRLVTVGRRGRDFMLRHGWHVVADFSETLPPRPTSLDVAPIARTIIDDFQNGQYDEVYLIYTEFLNTLSQRPIVRPLLPVRPFELEMDSVMAKYLSPEVMRITGEYIYEPNAEAILGQMLPRFTELQIYQAILEALASEHSARMVAMRNATDNANALLEHLTLSYNRARQEAITKEMLDIAGGAEALRKSIQSVTAGR